MCWSLSPVLPADLSGILESIDNLYEKNHTSNSHLPFERWFILSDPILYKKQTRTSPDTSFIFSAGLWHKCHVPVSKITLGILLEATDPV